MNKIIERTFALLRASYTKEAPETAPFEGMTVKEWEYFFFFCSLQGIQQLLYKQITRLPKELMPPQIILYKWIANAEYQIEGYRQQAMICEELSSVWAAHGIKVVVLKGMAFAQYYDEPALRSFGDFDCYLGEDYARGNVLAREVGAEVNDTYYKHSHIEYKCVLCENHQMLLPTRMGSRIKRLNAEMAALLAPSCLHPLCEGSAILAPSVEFDIKYQLYHIYRHFIDEDIAFRDLYDWAMILREAVRQGVDMQGFADFCRQYGLAAFVAVINDLVHKHIGVEIPSELPTGSKYSDKVLHAIYRSANKIYNRETGRWKLRLLYIRNIFRNGWKHHKIAGDTIIGYLFRSVFGFLLKNE